MIKRCVIITAYSDYDISCFYKKQEGDFIICADGGIDIAEKSAIFPNALLGDFDSANTGIEKYPFIKFPKEKDDTDTMLCLKYGLELGYKNFSIIGGIGGRFDHTISNLQTLAYAKEHGAEAVIYSHNTTCQMLFSGEKISINKKDGFYLSIFSYSEKCEGVNVNGTKYELSDGELYSSFPLGVSNEFKDEKAHISIKKGKLLIITSKG